MISNYNLDVLCLIEIWLKPNDYVDLKGHSTSGKMNVYLKWVIRVEEM